MSVRPQAAFAAACLLASPAAAHAIAGARVFPVTLTIDDPGVADEASFPTVTYQHGDGAVQEVDLGAEFDKRITEDFGFALNDGTVIQDTEHDKTRVGANDLVITGKYQAFISAPHELIVSIGVIREFGHTGTTHTGADIYGSTAPTLYFGKGLGDLPIGALRAFALTGEFSYAVADRELKSVAPPPALPPVTGLAAAQFNNGYANRWSGGLSLQYSLPYLVSQVRDLPIPGFFRHLVPLVELAWSSPAATPSNQPTQLVAAPGAIWMGQWYQVGVEALIPCNRASGSHVGLITQFHVFFDDLLPHSLGRPVFE